MFCSHCGKQVGGDERFCPHCGKPLASSSTQKKQQKVSTTTLRILVAAAGVVVVLLIVTVAMKFGLPEMTNSAATSSTAAATVTVSGKKIRGLQRPTLISSLDKEAAAKAAPALSKYRKEGSSDTSAGVKPDIKSYSVEDGLSNVTNANDIFLPEAVKPLLTKNGFAIAENTAMFEFFETYEMNRYDLVPNFVTTDSMMHSYHLYFSYLLKTCERGQLSTKLRDMSEAMLRESQDQLSKLTDDEWQNAAWRNVAFFSVACKLCGSDTPIPEAVESAVDSEVAQIMAASTVGSSVVLSEGTKNGVNLDYTQFKPRGYYEGDATLEAYFRTMMWYGQVNFTQSEETLDRSALLMTMALNSDAMSDWEAIYTITSFFAGVSDDNGYYEYWPIIQAVYGDDVSVESLNNTKDKWNTFHKTTAHMQAPKINSVVVADRGKEADRSSENLGFRFMGQRFSLDERIFSQLMYSRVGENSAGEKRMLPNALDVPSVLGSTEAQAILHEAGADDFANYSDNRESLRKEIAQNADELWTGSLYAQWLYTLNPLLATKGEGYPAFMQSKEWERKNLQTYLASYTELKHDTVLYSKQAMAEMGGGPIEELDDRGYVEPEPELYGRLARLTQGTKEGLSHYGVLSSTDADGLKILAELASQLEAISKKELANEKLSDEEYEFIRSYGGQLEHIWDLTADTDNQSWTKAQERPAAIVTDIATDPNGSVLQVGTGILSTIYVVFPIDGELHIAVGAVSNFYQFTQPIDSRLTDSEWRSMLGISASPDANATPMPEKPAWTKSFSCEID